MRRTVIASKAFTMWHKRGTGVYDEDHVNDFDAKIFNPARHMMHWYSKMEHQEMRRTLLARRNTQSDNNESGLHHSGTGVFEREMERKGIEHRKYPLTTTTGATRVRELVLLRRQELEKRGAAALAKQRADKQRDAPSEWFDETKGPLNRNFVKMMQPLYQNSRRDFSDLPRKPIVHAEFVNAESERV